MNMTSTSNTYSQTRNVNVLTCLNVGIVPRYTPPNKQIHIINILFACTVSAQIRDKSVYSHFRKHNGNFKFTRIETREAHTANLPTKKFHLLIKSFNYSTPQCFTF